MHSGHKYERENPSPYNMPNSMSADPIVDLFKSLCEYLVTMVMITSTNYIKVCKLYVLEADGRKLKIIISNPQYTSLDVFFCEISRNTA